MTPISVYGFKDSRGYFHDTEELAIQADLRYKLESYSNQLNELYWISHFGVCGPTTTSQFILENSEKILSILIDRLRFINKIQSEKVIKLVLLERPNTTPHVIRVVLPCEKNISEIWDFLQTKYRDLDQEKDSITLIDDITTLIYEH